MMFILIFVALLVGILTYLYYRIQNNIKPLQYKSDVRLDGKTVLITGATSGIGKATAFEIAAYGPRVILACRNREKAETVCQEIQQQTGNENISVVDLDLSDLDSVKSAADKIKETETRLDILINNAAIGWAENQCSKQGFDLTFATNHFGPFLFTHLLMDLIKKSSPSRIINVSSSITSFLRSDPDYSLHTEGSSVKYSELKGYAISKLANIYHCRFLNEELAGTGVTVNVMHPGFVETNIMMRKTGSVVKGIFNIIFRHVSSLIARSPNDASKTLLYMAIDPDLAEVSGEYFENVTIQTHQLTKMACDQENINKMREVSYLACKDYLVLPDDITEVEEVGAIPNENAENERELVNEEHSTSKSETTTVSEPSSVSAEQSESGKPVGEELPKTTDIETTTAAAAVTVLAAETVTATTDEATKIPPQETNAPLDLNKPTFTTSHDDDVTKEIENITSNTTQSSKDDSLTSLTTTTSSNNPSTDDNPASHSNSSTKENTVTSQETIYKPLLLPDITESNEHYPPSEGDSNLSCDNANICSDRTSSSREDSPLITLDENSDVLHEEGII
ncbi:dehydrogenase/reductase SDR family member 13-like [Argonauta hians]